VRPLVAEMGGKNPAIVTANADLDRAAAGIVRSAYGLSGQKCSSCSRVVVDRSAHDALVERIAAGAQELVLGDPAEPRTNLGPVVGPAATARFDAAVDDARRDGTVVIGGTRDSNFVPPTLVTGLPLGHRLTRDELFLPFLTVTAVDSFEAALAEANAVTYGLTAGIFSEDPTER
jgi:1-pyrroline-5-carboxylate dehydrogenase